jgi:hypothetical protein
MLLQPEGPFSARLLRSILRPEILVRQIVKGFRIGPLDFRLAIQALDRPAYAFGVKQAAYLATKLKLPSVSVVEFGVAGGAGLVALERYALEIGKAYGIEVEVYGFDLGSGLPAPSDYRDLGYVWKRGAYKMGDPDSLRKRLKIARLLLGDVEETVPQFLAAHHAPVGFISFDLDFYSSTMNAFRIFSCPDEHLLPRIFCYFDDIVSDGHQLHCEEVGELLAIREFNENSNRESSLLACPILKSGTVFPAVWQDQLRVYHRFEHRDYNTYIGA